MAHLSVSRGEDCVEEGVEGRRRGSDAIST